MRAVDCIARRDLFAPGPEEGGRRAGGRGRIERKDRADWRVGVDVGRAVQRIDGDRDQPLGFHRQDLVFLFRSEIGDGRSLQRAQHRIVGEDIEILLRVAVGIGLARRLPERAGKRAETGNGRYFLGCIRERDQRRSGGSPQRIARRPSREIFGKLVAMALEMGDRACHFYCLSRDSNPSAGGPWPCSALK